MRQDTTILIDELRQRRTAACQRFLVEYGAAVFRSVQRIVSRYEDADGVYQDVFVKALRSIVGFNPRQASLATWLSRIAYNESINFLHRQMRELFFLNLYTKEIYPRNKTCFYYV